jgi:hypothetical protein
MKTEMYFQEEYLLLHDWLRVGNQWIVEPEEARWTLSEAVNIQRLNDRYGLLVKAGWNCEAGGGLPSGYMYYVSKMRSPLGFPSPGKRVILTVANAFKRQSIRGWEPLSDVPTLSVFRVGNALRLWCAFCEDWHLHGAGNKMIPVGETAGHRVAHCIYDSPYKKCGYYLKVKYAIPKKPELRVVS